MTTTLTLLSLDQVDRLLNDMVNALNGAVAPSGKPKQDDPLHTTMHILEEFAFQSHRSMKGEGFRMTATSKGPFGHPPFMSIPTPLVPVESLIASLDALPNLEQWSAILRLTKEHYNMKEARNKTYAEIVGKNADTSYATIVQNLETQFPDHNVCVLMRAMGAIQKFQGENNGAGMADALLHLRTTLKRLDPGTLLPITSLPGRAYAERLHLPDAIYPYLNHLAALPGLDPSLKALLLGNPSPEKPAQDRPLPTNKQAVENILLLRASVTEANDKEFLAKTFCEDANGGFTPTAHVATPEAFLGMLQRYLTRFSRDEGQSILEKAMQPYVKHQKRSDFSEVHQSASKLSKADRIKLAQALMETL